MTAPNEKLEKQAILWLVRLQSQTQDAALQQACLQWRQQHVSHETAWQAVQTSYQQLRQQIQQVPADLPVPVSSLLRPTVSRPSRRRAFGQLGGVLLFALPASWAVREYTPWQRLRADVSTTVGQRKRFTLPDGTQLALNTDSAIRFHPAPSVQQIVLDRGEISLQRTANAATAALPWRVVTNDGQVLVTDGHVDIRRQAQGSLVHASTGDVRLQGQHMRQAVALEPGHDVLLTTDQVQRLPPSGLDRLAWTDGMLVAHDLPLADFLSEVGRYRPGRLDWQPDIADWRISGTYQLDDTDSLLALLTRALPVAVQQRTRYWVTVSAST